MTAENQRAEMYSGDDQQIEVTVTEGGDPVDLSNSTLEFAIADAGTVEVTKTTSGGGITISGTKNDVAVIQLDASDTQSLAGNYDIELEETDGNGNVATLLRGTLTIKEDIIT